LQTRRRHKMQYKGWIETGGKDTICELLDGVRNLKFSPPHTYSWQYHPLPGIALFSRGFKKGGALPDTIHPIPKDAEVLKVRYINGHIEAEYFNSCGLPIEKLVLDSHPNRYGKPIR
jgi:hypothetical protein